MREKLIATILLLYVLTAGFSCAEPEKRTQQPQTDVVPAPSEGGAQRAQVADAASAQTAAGLNTVLTTQAWEAFNRRDYKAAIESADKCIDEFLGRAMREQEDLQAKNAPLPPVGAVSNQQKQAIHEHGLLNDVATCLYIKGRSLEGDGRKTEALKVYKEAAKYTYARCWDPQGWFWSLSEGALDRLRMLE
jgi:tetratricopeptide (TPR) repeat protein